MYLMYLISGIFRAHGGGDALRGGQVDTDDRAFLPHSGGRDESVDTQTGAELEDMLACRQPTTDTRAPGKVSLMTADAAAELEGLLSPPPKQAERAIPDAAGDSCSLCGPAAPLRPRWVLCRLPHGKHALRESGVTMRAVDTLEVVRVGAGGGDLVWSVAETAHDRSREPRVPL